MREFNCQQLLNFDQELRKDDQLLCHYGAHMDCLQHHILRWREVQLGLGNELQSLSSVNRANLQAKHLPLQQNDTF